VFIATPRLPPDMRHPAHPFAGARECDIYGKYSRNTALRLMAT
jgi:hypothetical protein